MTIKELARQCKVSTATVSRAFDSDSSIKASTREKILKAAEEHHYSPNLIARGLKKNQTNTIGFIIPSVENHFYISVLKYIEIELQKYGYRMLISFIQKEIQTEEEAISVMLASHVDALILVPHGTVDRKKIEEISKKTYILQLFNVGYDFLDCVFMDDRQGVKNALHYLLQRGHERILYVSEAPHHDIYAEAYRENGLVADDACILQPYSSVESIAEQILRLKPTAILGVALHAESAWLAVRQCRLTIPTDMSFLAYDDVRWVRMLDITAIAHNYEDIAKNAVQLLMDNLPGSKETREIQHIKLMPYLVERSSVTPCQGFAGNLTSNM